MKPQQLEREEVYRLQRIFVIYKCPTETQYASIVSKPALYKTHWDITSETIRVLQQAYEASLNTDLAAPLRVPLCQSSLYSKTEQDSSPDMLRINQRTHAQNDCIARLSLHHSLTSYKAQVQKRKFDQIVRNNCFCVMTQLSKILCYCNKTSTTILSSCRPMPNFQPHKKKITATECIPPVTPPKKQKKQPTVIPKPDNS